MGIDAAAERALEVAWDGTEVVWLSFDVDCLDAAFLPGTGWPEPGGFLPREVLKFIQLVAARPLAGIEVVECSPPYDNAEITALIATRVICDTLGLLCEPVTSPAARRAHDLGESTARRHRSEGLGRPGDKSSPFPDASGDRSLAGLPKIAGTCGLIDSVAAGHAPRRGPESDIV